MTRSVLRWRVVLATALALGAAAAPSFAQGRELPPQRRGDPPRVLLEGLATPWRAANDIEGLGFRDGLMQGTAFGADPYVENNDVRLDAAKVDAIELRMAVRGSRSAQLYFAPISEANAFRFATIPDGKVHTYVVPVATLPGWQGTIQHLRIDPANDLRAWFGIASVRPLAEAGGPRVAFLYDGPESLVLPQGGRAAVSLRVVLTGGEGASNLRVTAVAGGAVRLAQAERAIGALAFGQTSEPVTFEISANEEGPGSVIIQVAGAATEEVLSIRCESVRPETTVGTDGQWPRQPEAAVPVLPVDVGRANTAWHVVEGAVVPPDEPVPVIGVLSGSVPARLALHGVVTCPERFVLLGRQARCVLTFADSDGRRHGVAFATPDAPALVVMPAPAEAVGRPITLESLTVEPGTAVGGVWAAGVGAPRVVLHGEGLHPDTLTDGAYVAQIRHPLRVRLYAVQSPAPGGDAAVEAAFAPALVGGVRAGRPLVVRNDAVRPAPGADVDVLTIPLDALERLGIYEVTVRGQMLPEPAVFRVTFIESVERLPGRPQ